MSYQRCKGIEFCLSQNQYNLISCIVGIYHNFMWKLHPMSVLIQHVRWFTCNTRMSHERYQMHLQTLKIWTERLKTIATWPNHYQILSCARATLNGTQSGCASDHCKLLMKLLALYARIGSIKPTHQSEYSNTEWAAWFPRLCLHSCWAAHKLPANGQQFQSTTAPNICLH